MTELQSITFPDLQWRWVSLQAIAALLGLSVYETLQRWYYLNFAAEQRNMIFTQGEYIQRQNIWEISVLAKKGKPLYVPLGWWNEVQRAKRNGYDGCIIIEDYTIEEGDSIFSQNDQLREFWDEYLGGSDTLYLVIGTKNWNEAVKAL